MSIRNDLAEIDIFERIFESTPDGLMVVGKEARITHANAQAVMMFGYSHEELVGKTIELLIPKPFQYRYAAHRLGYIVEPGARPTEAGLELFGRRKNGMLISCALTDSSTELAVLPTRSRAMSTGTCSEGSPRLAVLHPRQRKFSASPP